MGRVALVVVAAYALILAALTLPVGMLAFVPTRDTGPWLGLMEDGRYWGWLVAGVAGEAALLFAPVRIASRRPVSRRALLWPIAATGFLLAVLLIGAVLAIDELIARNAGGRAIGFAVIAGVVVWVAWTVVFYRFSAREQATDAVARQCGYLLKGSLLELLIVVPTHIVVRSRDYCCAGVGTFVGIAFGIAVMLFSFGPGVFFLYAERWSRLRPRPDRSAADGAA